MNQFATADQAAANPAAKSFETAQNAWRRNLQASAEATRALQVENAKFAAQLFDLNLRAARAFAPATPGDQRATPLELGASAVELYLDYLGHTAALTRQAIVLPWTEAQA